MKDNVVQVGEHGRMYRLREPHTIETIRADAVYADEHKKPLLCRLKHRWTIVGMAYVARDDPIGSTLSLLASSWPFSGELKRCRRCRKVVEGMR